MGVSPPYDDGSPKRKIGTWEVSNTVITAIVQAANQYRVPAALLASIAAAESGFNPLAYNYNPGDASTQPSYDRGLFQINTVYAPATSSPIDWSRIYDPFYNAQVAADIIARRYHGDWSDAIARWSTRAIAWRYYQDPWWRGVWEQMSSTWNAEWLYLQIPASMDNSRGYWVPVGLRNASSATWEATGANLVQLGYQWLNTDRSVATGYPDTRTPLPHDVPSGGAIELSMSVQTPASPGAYILVARLAREGAFWFDQTMEATVSVANPTAPIPPGSPRGFGDRTLLATGASYELEQAAATEANNFAEGDYGEMEIDFRIGFVASAIGGIAQWLIDRGAVLWDEVFVEGSTMVIRFRRTLPVVPIIIGVLGFFTLMWLVQEWRLYWFPPKTTPLAPTTPSGGGAASSASTGNLLAPALAAGGVLLGGVLLSRRPK